MPPFCYGTVHAYTRLTTLGKIDLIADRGNHVGVGVWWQVGGNSTTCIIVVRNTCMHDGCRSGAGEVHVFWITCIAYSQQQLGM